MQDYKTEQWWIDLQKSLDGFDDSIMSDGKLKQLNGSIRRGSISGKANLESGHWHKVLVMGGKAQGKIQGKKNVESGHLDNIRKLQYKAVLQFDKDGNFIFEYESQGDAARATNLKQCKISEVCSGNRKSTGGFIWKYKDEKDLDISN